MFSGFWQKIGCWPNDIRNHWKNNEDWLWFHAVSVGELNAIFPLVQKLKNIKSKYPIIISCTTKAGYEHAKTLTRNSDICVIYFPFDIPLVLKSFFNKIKIKLLIIAETEIWPNILNECKNREIPVILINGRLSDKSFRNYHLFKFYFKNVLNNFSEILTQSQKDTEKYLKLGANTATVETIGNLKFYTDDDYFKENNNLELNGGHGNIIFASTHEGAELLAIETYKELLKIKNNIRLIIAPRHITRVTQIVDLIKREGFDVTLRSENKKTNTSHNIFLLDTIGELKHIFKFCPVTIIGGTFTKVGGHNILEPIKAGSYTIIGPYDFKIKELTSVFIGNNALVQVKNKDELVVEILDALNNNEQVKERINNGVILIKKNENVIEKYLEHI